jgi:long-subunit fatty acid transport protein
MSFERPGDRLQGRRLRAVALLALGAAAAPPARAAPLDEPFVGGMSFSGPTSGNLAAIYWNPAALGLVRGVQVMAAASGRLTRTTASLPAGQATSSTFTQPVQYPLGPGGFLGASWDLGADRFTIGVAAYTPFTEQIHYPVAADRNEPTRYYVLDADLRNFALTPALSIRFLGDFRLGFAPGFLFSTGRWSFAEDPPGGTQSPATDVRYDVDSGQGLGDTTFSVTLGGGLYYRRRAVEVGVAYSSRPIGGDRTGVDIGGSQSRVTLPSGMDATCGIGGVQQTRCVFGDLNYRLPDTWTAGVTVHPSPGLEVTGMVRWIRLSVHDRLDFRITGPTDVPQHIVIYRGFQDVWDTRLRVAYWWRERVRIGAVLRLETSAVPADAVDPAAVDGLKLEPVGLIEARLTQHLWLGGGYGLTFMPDVTVSSSAFNPGAGAACTAAGGSLDNESCRERLAGRARPSPAGTYSRFSQDFGVTVTARF